MKVITIIPLILSFTTAFAQEFKNPDYIAQPDSLSDEVAGYRELNRYNYYGVATGFNSNSGLFALQADIILLPKIYAGFSGGIGLYGGIAGTSLSYFFNENQKGFEVTGGYSYHTGLRELWINIFEQGISWDIPFRLNSGGAAHLGIAWNWHTLERVRLSFLMGYSLPVHGLAFDKLSNQTVPVEAMEQAENIMEIVQPGGFMIGLRLMIGDLKPWHL